MSGAREGYGFHSEAYGIASSSSLFITPEEVEYIVPEMESPTLKYETKLSIGGRAIGFRSCKDKQKIENWIREINQSRRKSGEDMPVWKVDIFGNFLNMEAEYPEAEPIEDASTPEYLLRRETEVKLKSKPDDIEQLLEDTL